MKITFLSDNITENAGCLAEWGLSVYIQSGGRNILFDMGASPIFAENAGKLGVDLSEVDFAVISHGHYDHTGGMDRFLDLNDSAPVYIHRNALQEFYGTDENGNMDDYNCGVLWDKDLLERAKTRLVFTDHVTEIDGDISLIGDIAPLPEFPVTEQFYIPENPQKSSFRKDPMDHEQIMVIREGEGLHVFSGCSHTGIMAIIKKVEEEYPGERIVSITAGMHLYALPSDKKQLVVDSIAGYGVRYVLPVHCTGMEAILMFRERMGKGCVIASAGETYEF